MDVANIEGAVGDMNENEVETLRGEYEDLTKGIKEREDWLAAKRPRFQKLSDFFSEFEQLTGKAAVVAPKPAQVEETESPFGDKARAKTTGLVADLVTRSGRRMTREQVVVEWPKVYGGYPAWQNIDNTIGTALGRAVKRGMIDEKFGLYFAKV